MWSLIIIYPCILIYTNLHGVATYTPVICGKRKSSRNTTGSFCQVLRQHTRKIWLPLLTLAIGVFYFFGLILPRSDKTNVYLLCYPTALSVGGWNMRQVYVLGKALDRYTSKGANGVYCLHLFALVVVVAKMNCHIQNCVCIMKFT